MAKSDETTWRPTPEYVEQSTLAAFLREHELDDFDHLVRRSNEDPEWYWNAIIQDFSIRFYKPYERLMDTGDGPPWAKWCVGGTTNLVLNCLDRHEGTPVMEKPAVIWEGEDDTVRIWTYTRLIAETARLAEALRFLGLGKGDAVGIFMPMMPETMAAFFAVTKIGAIVVPLFSGFGTDALVSRLNDAGSVALITVDGTRRRGKTVSLKAIITHYPIIG